MDGRRELNLRVTPEQARRIVEVDEPMRRREATREDVEGLLDDVFGDGLLDLILRLSSAHGGLTVHFRPKPEGSDGR